MGFKVNRSAVSDFKKRAYAELDKRLLAFAETLRDYIRELISTPTATHGTSDPYHPPHLDTGELHDSITVTKYMDGYAVGSDVPHAIKLELGTAHMEPRPFLIRSLLENIDVLNSIVG